MGLIITSRYFSFSLTIKTFKTVFSPNENSDFVTSTAAIVGCAGMQSCPFDQFYNRNKPFLVDHPVEVNNLVLFKRVEMFQLCDKV